MNKRINETADIDIIMAQIKHILFETESGGRFYVQKTHITQIQKSHP